MTSIASERGPAKSFTVTWFVSTAIAVLYCVPVLGLTRLLRTGAGASYKLFMRGRVARLVRRRPATLVVVVVGLFAVTQSRGDALPAILRWPILCLLMALFVPAAAALVTPTDSVPLREVIEKRWPERWFATRLRNPLDAYFVRMLVNNTIIAGLPFVLIMLPATFGAASCVIFILGLVSAGPAHETLDHTNIHNAVFSTHRQAKLPDRCAVGAINWYLEYLLNPVMGRACHWYRVQHVSIHHAEDNGLADSQSTLPYDRLSFLDFCRVSLHQLLSLMFAIDVFSYLYRRRRGKQLRLLVQGMVFYYGLCMLLAMWSLPAAVVLVGLPSIRAPSMVAFYYRWHAFVDLDDPDNVFKNTTHIAVRGEATMALGGNSHIEHHLHPARHWSELDAGYEANRERYRDEGAMVIWPILPYRMAGLLFMRRFDVLAKHVVAIGHVVDKPTIERLLAARAAPLLPTIRPRAIARMDERVGKFLGKLLLA